MDNMEEMDRFLEKFNLQRLNQEEIEIIKCIMENIGRTLDNINQSKIFYDPPPRIMK